MARVENRHAGFPETEWLDKRTLGWHPSRANIILPRVRWSKR